MEWLYDTKEINQIIKKVMVQGKTVWEQPKIERVIFNNPATIVFWSDGIKTVVKVNGESFDKEKGLAMAIVKRLMGNNKGNYFNEIKKWVGEDYDPKKEPIE